MTFPYFTQRMQRKALRCIRCVVKETAPNCQILRRASNYHALQVAYSERLALEGQQEFNI